MRMVELIMTDYDNDDDDDHDNSQYIRALSQTAPTWVNGRTVIPLKSDNFPKCYLMIIYFYLWFRITSVER